MNAFDERQILLILEGQEYADAFKEFYGFFPKQVPVGHKVGPDWNGDIKTVRTWVHLYN